MGRSARRKWTKESEIEKWREKTAHSVNEREQGAGADSAHDASIECFALCPRR